MSESMVTAAAAEDESVIEESEYETAAADTAGEEYISEDYDSEKLGDTAVSAESGAFTNGSIKNSARNEFDFEKEKNNYIESIYGSNLWIEETEEVPGFYNDADTKCVMMRGVELYVGRDFDETWIVYAETDAGKYIIRTELTGEEIGQEEFVKAAYEMLAETVGNAN